MMTWTDAAPHLGTLLALGGFVACLVAIAIWPEVFERDEE